MKLRLAAIASGRGSNVAALIKSIDEGTLDAELVLVLSNNPHAKVLELVQEKGIATWSKSHKGIAREDFDAELVQVLQQHKADTIALAGYMRMVTPVLLNAFPERVINVHPALLPSFAGVNGGGDAIAYGVRFTGVTVHFVDEGMDSGPIIIQGILPVAYSENEDTLMPRIHALEHLLYTQALQWMAEKRVHIVGRKVEILPKKGQTQQGQLPQKTTNSCTEPVSVLATLGHNGCVPWLISPPLEKRSEGS